MPGKFILTIRKLGLTSKICTTKTKQAKLENSLLAIAKGG